MLAQLLHLLHPLTPFVTEELWERRYGAPGGRLIAARWPELPGTLVDPEAEAELDWLIRLVTGCAPRAASSACRRRRASACRSGTPGPTTLARLERHGEAIRRLARCADIEIATGAAPSGAIQVVVDEATYALPLAGVIDLEQERRRLDRELAKAAAELERFDQKLANPQFLDRAPAAVVEEQRARRAEAEQTRQKLAAARARIAS